VLVELEHHCHHSLIAPSWNAGWHGATVLVAGLMNISCDCWCRTMGVVFQNNLFGPVQMNISTIFFWMKN
jgi:hypothetical protein